MKGKWILSCLAMLICSTATAEDEFSYYAGVSAGSAYSEVNLYKRQQNVTSAVSDGTVEAINYFNSATDVQRFSGLGAVQFGLGYTYERMYLGLEISGQFSNGSFGSADNVFHFNGENDETPNSESNGETHLRMSDFEPTIDLMPGFFLTENSLLYLRVGAAFNRIKLKDLEHNNSINNRPGVTPSVFDITTSASEDVVALRLGLGLEHRLTEKLSIRMDYAYTQYGDIEASSHIIEPALNGVLQLDIHNRVKAEDINKQTVMLGVNYYL